MLDDLVDGFNLAIGLQVIWCGKVFPDAELFVKIQKTGVVKLFSVLDEDGVKYTKFAYDMLPYEIGCFLPDNFGKWFYLGPFGEMFYCYDSELNPAFFHRHMSN